jgi:C4-dicarboxylate-binding protein DctP
LLSLLLALLSASGDSVAAQNISPIPLRISVENPSTHVQTVAVREFAERIAERLGSRIRVEFYDSATLFRDSEVISAIARGNLEMAVPGTWHVSAVVPELSYFLLPEFYGVRTGADRALFEQSTGAELLSRLERKMQVVIPGQWLDLGPAHVFTTGAVIRSAEDFSGLRIRVAGGEANRLRVEALGAAGTIIPFPDLISALDRGAVDGVLTTFETVRSARLWEHGVSYAYMDYQYFPQYIPVIGRSFWVRLSPREQQVVRETWNEVAARQRTAAALAQADARRQAELHGVVIYEPPERIQQATREVLLSRRAAILDALDIDREFVLRLTQDTPGEE